MTWSRVGSLAALVALGVASSGPAGAQVLPASPIALEVRAGLSFPSGVLASGQRDIALDLGLSVGAAALLRLGPAFAVYGGWSRQGFACEARRDCDVDGDFTSRGYDAGVEVVLPHATVFEPWMRVGGTLHRFRYRTGGGFETETDAVIGFEIGGGVSIPVSVGLSLAPSLRFARYVAKLDLNTHAAGGEPFAVTRMLLELGGRFRP